MAELGDRLDLALEALGERALTGGLTRQDLECDDPVHAAVAGLEDGAHAAGPQPIEDNVVADTQLGHSALQNGVGLKGRQPAGADQAAGERPGVRDAGFAAEPSSAQIGLREEPALAHTPHEFLTGDGPGHPQCSSIGFSPYCMMIGKVHSRIGSFGSGSFLYDPLRHSSYRV